MSKKSNTKITILFVLSVSLVVVAMTTYLLTIYYRQVCFHILGGFCDNLIEKNPDSRQAVLEVLKTKSIMDLLQWGADGYGGITEFYIVKGGENQDTVVIYYKTEAAAMEN